MEKPQHHILVCASFRVAGEAKGACHRKEAVSLLQYLETEIIDRNLDARVSSTWCLKQCEHGPVMVIYPEGHWYGEVNEEKIDEVLDAIGEGGVAEGALA